MGRPPCCDKEGVKKGPWTPEEDILLVTYIQEHGPGNWRAVPSNTGLLRCSKSCRLRWTNYLRPGIKRGNFTEQEEKMIIHLQALLGNRWAAIASYLPQRTDNDIKNYWNTHLNKKLRKLQSSPQLPNNSKSDYISLSSQSSIENPNNTSSRGQWEKRLHTDIHMAKQVLSDALSTIDQTPSTKFAQFSNSSPKSISFFPNHKHGQNSTYAWSTENVSKLLRNWSGNCPKKAQGSSITSEQQSFSSTFENDYAISNEEASQSEENINTVMNNVHHEVAYEETFQSLFDSKNIESMSPPNSEISETSFFEHETKPLCEGGKSRLLLFEKWLCDDINSMQNCGPHDQDEDLADLPLQENFYFL